ICLFLSEMFVYCKTCSRTAPLSKLQLEIQARSASECVIYVKLTCLRCVLVLDHKVAQSN
ncbi:MAG: hypothetical protein ACR2NU_04840, partial [Aeoliella sp.]